MALTVKDFDPIIAKYSRGAVKFKPYWKASANQRVNARIQYAKTVELDQCVALFDTTFLKNGKSGYLLTMDGLYSSQFGGKVICFSSVKEVNWGSGKLQVTYKNGKKADFPAETYASELCALIRDVLALLGTDAAPKPAKAAPKKPAAEKKPAETKESLAQKKAALQAELAKLEAEQAALDAEQAELERQKAQAAAAEKAAQKEAQRAQAQADFDKQLAELDTFLEELVIEEKPAPVKPAPAPKPKQVEAPAQTAIPTQWKLMDSDTEWNFEQAVRCIMEGDWDNSKKWIELVKSAGHPMAEQLLWLMAGELDKYGDRVHLFFRALDDYSKKRYAKAVALFKELAEQGCADAMVALGYDAVLPLNGSVDDRQAMSWRERVHKVSPVKGGVLAMLAVNIDTQRRLAEIDKKYGWLEYRYYTDEGYDAYQKGDYALAIQKWEEGDRHRVPKCAHNLAILYNSEKIPRNKALSNQWYCRYADLEENKEEMLKVTQLLYRNAETLQDVQVCAHCDMKLLELGGDFRHITFERLMKLSKTAEDFEVCLEYAKRLIKAGRFEGIRMLNGATWRMEDAREKLHPKDNGAEHMEHVECMETFKPGKVKKMIPILESCAEAKVGGAAFTLFQLYSQGIGVAADKQKARYWADKVQVRDEVLFGFENRYPMGWTVLAREGGRILLLSNDMLAQHDYDPKGDVTWENCELRRWMNSKLLDKLFTKEEQKLIATVRNKNPGDPMHWIPNGNDTMDRLFLLSAEEVKRYFTTYETGEPLDLTVVTDSLTRMGVPSNLAQSGYADRSTFSFRGERVQPWLLRTPGEKLRKHTSVSDAQYINYHDTNGRNEIRPALWIDLDV